MTDLLAYLLLAGPSSKGRWHRRRLHRISGNRPIGPGALEDEGWGEMVWEKTFAGAGFDLGRSIVSTKDGGLAIVGWTESQGSGGQDLWLLKT